VELKLNSVEGTDDGIAVARGVSNEDAVLARIRSDPNVEAAEPLKVPRRAVVVLVTRRLAD